MPRYSSFYSHITSFFFFFTFPPIRHTTVLYIFMFPPFYLLFYASITFFLHFNFLFFFPLSLRAAQLLFRCSFSFPFFLLFLSAPHFFFPSRFHLPYYYFSFSSMRPTTFLSSLVFFPSPLPPSLSHGFVCTGIFKAIQQTARNDCSLGFYFSLRG